MLYDYILLLILDVVDWHWKMDRFGMAARLDTQEQRSENACSILR